ncbi:MAG: hypothetical protein WDN49_12405 [Acetobacteraceae bacterium]
MPNDGNVIHTVSFFQGAFTIILSMSLGEALKSFTSDNQEHPLYWNRAPSLLAFLVIFSPFFQSMSQYFYSTYLNPQTALAFRSGYLVFDGVMYTLQAGCFFTMSRSLAPHRWRRFYMTVLILMLLDLAWGGVSFFRGVHVLGWLCMDVVLIVAILAMIWFERGKPASLRPSYIGLVLVTITTALGYWLEPDMYLP